MTRLNYFRFVKNFALNNFGYGHVYRPLNAQIELTLRCNAKCAFCSIWKPEFQKEIGKEMTTKDVLNEMMQKQVEDTGDMLNFLRTKQTLFERIRCKFGFHTAGRAGWVQFNFIERCQCGSIQMNGKGWFM